MPLSEQEQRLLEEMERSLYHNDADFVATVGKRGGRRKLPDRRARRRRRDHRCRRRDHRGRAPHTDHRHRPDSSSCSSECCWPSRPRAVASPRRRHRARHPRPASPASWTVSTSGGTSARTTRSSPPALSFRVGPRAGPFFVPVFGLRRAIGLHFPPLPTTPQIRGSRPIADPKTGQGLLFVVESGVKWSYLDPGRSIEGG